MLPCTQSLYTDDRLVRSDHDRCVRVGQIPLPRLDSHRVVYFLRNRVRDVPR